MAAASSLLATVRLSSWKSDGCIPTPTPLSVAKPTWVVRTESNVRRKRKKKPDPPCVVCLGTGRVGCNQCNGRGRTNYVHLEMLPKGEWPKWCKTCGGSGLSFCSRCLGTGEYRNAMGFHFMRRDSDQTRSQDNKVQGNHSSQSSVERLLYPEQKNSNDEM